MQREKKYTIYFLYPSIFFSENFFDMDFLGKYFRRVFELPYRETPKNAPQTKSKKLGPVGSSKANQIYAEVEARHFFGGPRAPWRENPEPEPWGRGPGAGPGLGPGGRAPCLLSPGNNLIPGFG
jgi:hypothetical protein